MPFFSAVFEFRLLLPGRPKGRKKIAESRLALRVEFEVSRCYFVNWKFNAWITPSPIFAWNVMHWPAKLGDVFQL